MPSNLARHVVDDLMKYGEVRRGSIGYLGIEKLTPELAEELGAPDMSGALVVAHDPRVRGLPGRHPARATSSSASTDRTVEDPSQFFRFVADAKIGTTATLRLLRDGKPLDVKVSVVSSAAQRRRQ